MSFNTFAFIFSFYTKYSDNFSHYYISQLSGLSRKEPVLAISFALSLLSIAGIPPLAGFFSKYFVLLAIIENNFFLLSVLILLFSVIACFYYIRFIQFMFFKDSSTYSIKDLADIAYSKVSLNHSYIFNSHLSLNNRISGFHLPTLIIFASSFYIILTFFLYPHPFLMFTFDSLIFTFI